jgi:diacylglycerol kinase
MSQSNDARNPLAAKTLRSSFAAAWAGLWYAARTQRNMRVHLAATFAVACLGALLRITPGEWCVLVITIAAVIGTELLNTALESAIDLLSPDPHPLARTAKDAAAAAVLVMAAASVLVGLILFVPRLLPFVGW